MQITTVGRRIRSIEDGMLGIGRYEDTNDLDIPDPDVRQAMTTARAFRDHSKAFVNLSIYEQRLHRTIKDTFRQLKELQTERRAREEKEEAERASAKQEEVAERTTFKTKDLSVPSTGNGFVYASAEIAREGASPDPLGAAPIAPKSAFDSDSGFAETQAA